MGALPVVKLTWENGEADLWYVDSRLLEVRKVDNPHEAIPLDVLVIAQLIGAVHGEAVQEGDVVFQGGPECDP